MATNLSGGLGCAARLRWTGSNALRRVWRDKDSIGLIIRCPVTAKMNHECCGLRRCPKAESTNMPASRASPVVVVLDLIVAKQTDLIAALAWPEVFVSHVHVLHTEWAACHVRDASDINE